MAQPTILAGHYAYTFSNGVTRFFRIDVPTKGKWKGYTFVKRQAGDDYLPMSPGQRATILSLIEQNPEAASALYGQKIGRCGVCHRTLTDEDSRARGIGPVCADKF